ncbi:MAG: hypothetical protein GXO63_02245 [Candidatus Micrarchaeota archaeon]|nr:hypothetical protein [Candidatus Micrarchaeota archaeon]
MIKALSAVFILIAALVIYGYVSELKPQEDRAIDDTNVTVVGENQQEEIVPPAEPVSKRSYPKFIKGIWDPGFVEKDIKNPEYLRSLGVNTVVVIVAINDKLKEYAGPMEGEDAVEAYKWLVRDAKRNNFTVMLVLEYGYFKGNEMYPSKKFSDAEKFLNGFKNLSVKWAEIAEGLDVEYFSPINELDQVFFENGFSDDEIIRIENEFFGEVIPKIRKVYSGKIYCKAGSVHSRKVFPYEGCDILGTIIAPSRTERLEKISRAYLEKAQEWSRKTGKCWIVGEFFIPGADPNGYAIGINEINKSEVKPCGVVFMGPLNPAGGFGRNEESEKMVRDFFRNGTIPEVRGEYRLVIG